MSSCLTLNHKSSWSRVVSPLLVQSGLTSINQSDCNVSMTDETWVTELLPSQLELILMLKLKMLYSSLWCASGLSLGVTYYYCTYASLTFKTILPLLCWWYATVYLLYLFCIITATSGEQAKRSRRRVRYSFRGNTLASVCCMVNTTDGFTDIIHRILQSSFKLIVSSSSWQCLSLLKSWLIQNGQKGGPSI